MKHDRSRACAASDARALVDATLATLPVPYALDVPERLLRLSALLSEWGPKLGLSTIGAEGEALVRHVLDSLLVAAVVPQPAKVLDLGTGAGLPALPLSVLWPEAVVVAVDSRRRAAWAVARLAREVGASNVAVLCARADDPDLLAEHGGSACVVTSRGLAKSPVAVALSLPFVRPGGSIAILGGPDLDAWPAAPGHRVHVVGVPTTDWRRRILVVQRSPGGASQEGSLGS